MRYGIYLPIAADQFEQPRAFGRDAAVVRVDPPLKPRNRFVAAIAAVIARWRAATCARRERRYLSQLPWGQ